MWLAMNGRIKVEQAMGKDTDTKPLTPVNPFVGKVVVMNRKEWRSGHIVMKGVTS